MLCFSEARTVRLVRIKGKINRAKYREIFQQDIDRKHTAKTMLQGLQEKSLNVLEWSSQSVDLNLNISGAT